MILMGILYNRHLSGVKPILDEANILVMPTGGKPSRARVAAFWNFSYCGYLTAYNNPESADLARRAFSEMFYNIPLCAVTRKHYHFSRIIMLLHIP
jgi:hypothetical protein